jgi:hypothetical protein
MKFKTKRLLTPDRAREMGITWALLMILAFHFFEGPLENKHVFVALFGGVGFWAVFRYLVVPRQVLVD